MKTLIVVSHPRRDSLTYAVADTFAQGLASRGHDVEWAHLAAENFDPVLRESDEPDWNHPDKLYSPEVRREIARIERNEATVMVFPVWWWSLPGLLKGWIDRVWNHGFAYGSRTYPHQRAWMIGVAGVSQSTYRAGHYDTAIRTQWHAGILEYCGIADPRVELLFGSMDGPERVAAILQEAATLAGEY